MPKQESKDEFSKHLGSELKRFRKFKQVTLRDLETRHNGTDRGMVSKIEAGIRTCSTFTLNKILKGLNSNLKEFFEFYKEES